jgi:hypothetical protein
VSDELGQRAAERIQPVIIVIREWWDSGVRAVTDRALVAAARREALRRRGESSMPSAYAIRKLFGSGAVLMIPGSIVHVSYSGGQWTFRRASKKEWREQSRREKQSELFES